MRPLGRIRFFFWFAIKMPYRYYQYRLPPDIVPSTTFNARLGLALSSCTTAGSTVLKMYSGLAFVSMIVWVCDWTKSNKLKTYVLSLW